MTTKKLTDDELMGLSIQEACDYAVAKMVEQGCQSYDEVNDTCVYAMTDDDGQELHCAVGWLIPQRIYESNLIRDEASIEDLQLFSTEDMYEFAKDEEFLQTIPACMRTPEDRIVLKHLQFFHDRTIKNNRTMVIEWLNRKGIDSSAPQYQQWVDMGDE